LIRKIDRSATAAGSSKAQFSHAFHSLQRRSAGLINGPARNSAPLPAHSPKCWMRSAAGFSLPIRALRSWCERTPAMQNRASNIRVVATDATEWKVAGYACDAATEPEHRYRRPADFRRFVLRVSRTAVRRSEYRLALIVPATSSPCAGKVFFP